MISELSQSAMRVQEYLAARGHALRVVELADSTRTAADAAKAIGCEVAQIVKSLVFRAKDSGRPVLVVASGVNRVDEAKVAALLGEPVGKADAAFVRECTGFAIGGVPPVGHAEQIVTIMDEDLQQYVEIWAAAGTPHAVFRLTPDILRELAEPIVARIAQD
ncbi:YbaK/prolyl-tRNA synthetase associated region [Alkalidesulfovibrio alkalitolerans DSM 16529]|uniref:YbaK/prolyl-tRNA synthetase associated region n=1 Tax=Alkalidesulfovibrio alkalitolerans DSM 16529 TaxID=1121439 RepID=S7UFN3_9BACT|nr:YbaK/EbsC family protein [Alkalidesulfovibrio alkalitolerans]EPR31043.1 YbaK/prolyl-tRNA synthetase associated region [Alkalidesulfovibrio alkalitolerans DSM 16529]